MWGSVHARNGHSRMKGSQGHSEQFFTETIEKLTSEEEKNLVQLLMPMFIAGHLDYMIFKSPFHFKQFYYSVQLSTKMRQVFPVLVGVLIDHDNRAQDDTNPFHLWHFHFNPPAFSSSCCTVSQDSDLSSPRALSIAFGAGKSTSWCQVQLNVCYSSLVSCYEN